MSLINRLYSLFQEANALVEQAKTAEKAAVLSLKLNANEKFRQAYKVYVDSKLIINNPTTVQKGLLSHSELAVYVAETAYLTEEYQIARSIIEIFLVKVKGIQHDQLYCRAKLLLALLIDYEATEQSLSGSESLKVRKYAIKEINDALAVAMQPENAGRYKFVIYNTSVIFWRIVSPFLRAGRAKEFLSDIVRVSDALEALNDSDTTWRIVYLSAVAYCYDDDKNAKNASDYLDKALAIADNMLATTVAAENKLKELMKKISDETDGIMSSIRGVEEEILVLTKPKKVDPDSIVIEEVSPENSEEVRLVVEEKRKQISEFKTNLDAIQKNKALVEEKQKVYDGVRKAQFDQSLRLYMQRIHVNVADSKRIVGLPPMVQSARLRTLATIQCMLSGCIADKDYEATFNGILADLEKIPASSEKTETLFDVCRYAWYLNLRSTAINVATIAEASTSLNQMIRIKSDFCKALRIFSDISVDNPNEILATRLSADELEGYRVSKRIEIIKMLERIIMMCAGKIEDSSFVEEICIISWNVARPLLQNHLRSNVHRLFQLTTAALETLSSSLTNLRMMLHFELSKCEEQADFIVKARDECYKALCKDYGELGEAKSSNGEELNRNRNLDHIIKPFYRTLQLRGNVYDTPSDVESNVLLMLQQIKESTSISFQRDMLNKAVFCMLEVCRNPAFEYNSDKKLEVSIPNVPLEAISSVLEVDRGSASTPFNVFTELTYQRLLIWSTISKIAHAQRNPLLMQHSAVMLLEGKWSNEDKFVKPIVDMQIEAHFILIESFVEQLSKFTLSAEKEELMQKDQMELDEANRENKKKTKLISPFALGVTSKYATEEIEAIKVMTITTLKKALQLASLAKTEAGVQNVVIYFWNLHLHVFRKRIYDVVLDDFLAFLTSACGAIDTLQKEKLDNRLCVSLYEGLAGVYQQRGQFTEAIQASTKGLTYGNAYINRRLCEVSSRLPVLAAGGAAGGKGGKAPEPPKFDDPFLKVYSILSQCELVHELITKDMIASSLVTASNIMNNEVKEWIKKKDVPNMTKEEYDQLLEMQAECWTRITRGKFLIHDVIGSQTSAEQCLQLVNEDVLKKSDEKALSPRVWRWISVCEKYFGVSISKLIEAEGQEPELQYELRLASLRHFTLACNYAVRSQKEDLVAAAGKCAWNVMIPLIDVALATVKNSLFNLQSQIIGFLNNCSQDNDEISVLKQQVYLAMIEGQVRANNMDIATKLVFESFDNTPSNLQKPLWKWRVIVLCKQGKNVLDGMAALKENNPSLQAKVFGTLARASTNPAHQLDAYRQTTVILNNDLEKVDYMLETAQWMASNGAPRMNINELLNSAADALYEVEGNKGIYNSLQQEKFDETASVDDSSVSSARSGKGSKTGQTPPGSKRNSVSGPTGTAGSRRSSTSSSSRQSATIGSLLKRDLGSQSKLNAKQLEQLVRINVMLAVLESDENSRLNRCMEAIFFIHRFLGEWTLALHDLHKIQSYVALSKAEQEATPFDAYVAVAPTASLTVPTDALALHTWVPNSLVTEKMSILTSEEALTIPSDITVTNTPLTLYYTLWLADTLLALSRPKLALFCLGWCRCVLLYLPNTPNRDVAWATIHYKVVGIMNNLSLVDELRELPTHLGNTTVNCVAFISKLATPVLRTSGEIAANSQAGCNSNSSLFGLSAVTQTITKIDLLVCGIDLLQSLKGLQQYTVCRSLANTLLIEFRLQENHVGQCKVECVLAELAYLNGDYSDCLVILLESIPRLGSVGDPKLLAVSTKLAMRCYFKLGRSDEAKAVGEQTIQVLEEFCSLLISPASTSSHPNSSKASVHTHGQSRNSSSNKINIAPKLENSYENVTALTEVTAELGDLLWREAETASNGQIILNHHQYVSEKLTHVLSVTQAVAGTLSTPYSWLLAKKAALLWLFFQRIRAVAAKHYPKEVLQKLQDVALPTCVSCYEKSIEIRRALLSGLTIDDQYYFLRDASKKLPLPLILQLSTCELEFASLLNYFAALKEEHFSTPQIDFSNKNVTEKYLIETQSGPALDLAGFEVPALVKSLHLCTSACDLLSGTGFEIESLVLFHVSSMMQRLGSGDFDYKWVRVSDADSAQQQALHGKEISELQQATVAALAQRKYGCGIQGAFCMVDACGILDAKAAIVWLLYAQSISCRDWLYKIWRAALVPNTAVSCALNRYEQISNTLAPTSATMKQMELESSFLSSSSPAWRRLDISADPASILSKLAVNTVVMCIQLCPYSKVLYVGIGLPLASTPQPYAAEGKWYIDKMQLSEGNKRTLDALVVSQAAWQQDVYKFVSQYGDNIGPEQDLEGVESNYGDGRQRKYENSIEERLRALLLDLEDMLAPLIGPASNLDVFLQDLLGSAGTFSLQLFVDQSLQSLPWEGLSFMGKHFNNRVSRDFSIHLHGHRLVTAAQGQVVLSSTVKTVLDPYGDDDGNRTNGYERDGIIHTMSSLAGTTAVGGTKWNSLGKKNGKEGMSLFEWMEAAAAPRSSKPSTWFVYVPGRFGSFLNPKNIAVMNLEDVNLLFCSDNGLNDNSFRRQNTMDNVKNTGEVEAENPLKMAGFASLAGTASVVCNMWATTFTSQRRFVTAFWDRYSKKGLTLGECLAELRTSVGQEPEEKKVKLWVKLAKLNIGIPSFKYQDI